MKFKTGLLIGGAMVAFAAFPALAETVVTKEVTPNPDGTTTTTTTTTRYYHDTGTDINNNGILDSNEFGTFVRRSWDMNGDGFIDDSEWNAGTTRWYPTGYNEYKTYTVWDKDRDGRLDSTEFDTVVTTTKLYETWDVNNDKILEDDEYAAKTFSVYDENADGSLNLKEWQASRRY